MSRFLALLAVLILGLAGLTEPRIAARADDRETGRSFRDWRAACAGPAGCSASTAVSAEQATGTADYQLRIVPAAAPAGYEISLLSSAAAPDDTKELVLRVDDGKPLRLAPGSGYVAGGDGLVVQGDDLVRLLIRQMRAGGRLAVGFTDQAGEARQIAFSLWGLTAALDFIAPASEPGHSKRVASALAAAAAVAGDWSVSLVDYLPAMRRCLVATPGGPALVGKAWPMNKGMVGVRTVGPDGRRWDCVAEAVGRDVAMFDPVPKGAAALPGEGVPLFTPPGQRPPEQGCYRNERARDAAGEFAGWLSYPGC